MIIVWICIIIQYAYSTTYSIANTPGYAIFIIVRIL